MLAESLMNLELEYVAIMDDLNTRFAALEAACQLLDATTRLHAVKQLYTSTESIALLKSLYGKDFNYSFEGTIADVWERIKQFCAWIWNGIKKLFGIADKKIEAIKESIRKKREKAKDDNLGKTVTVRVVDRTKYENGVRMINERITALKNCIDGDFADLKAVGSEESGKAMVDQIRSDMNAKENIQVSKWSQVNSIIDGAVEREKQMFALSEQLSGLIKKLNDYTSSNQQNNGNEAKVKAASLFTQHIKSIMQSIAGVTNITISDVSLLARGGLTETDKGDVATGGEKK